MARAVVLVDGEHYPAVTRRALDEVARRGDEVAGAVFLGGREKLKGALDLGPVALIERPSRREALEAAIEEFHPDTIIDLSDAPVLDARERLLLASVALARGVSYRGADFAFEPPPRPRVAAAPSIAVIGAGKRAGKTAVAAFVAREAAARGGRPVVVAVGRGGPAEPVVVRADERAVTLEDLLAVAGRGEHAATDAYEDAVVARVATVAAWRAGAGMAGKPFADSVAAAVRAANALDPGLVVLEGSGTSIPPVAADASILVAGVATPAAEIAGGLAPVRLLLADLVVVTMCEEPFLSTETPSALFSAVRELARDVPIVRTVFRPTPVEPVSGKVVFVATTAPESAGGILRDHLERAHGVRVAGVTHHLGERAALAADLARVEGTYEVLLTELKAAAIDVAAPAALAAGAGVVFYDNTPVAVEGDLGEAVEMLERRARAAWSMSERHGA